MRYIPRWGLCLTPPLDVEKVFPPIEIEQVAGGSLCCITQPLLVIRWSSAAARRARRLPAGWRPGPAKRSSCWKLAPIMAGWPTGSGRVIWSMGAWWRRPATIGNMPAPPSMACLSIDWNARVCWVVARRTTAVSRFGAAASIMMAGRRWAIPVGQPPSCCPISSRRTQCCACGSGDHTFPRRLFGRHATKRVAAGRRSQQF